MRERLSVKVAPSRSAYKESPDTPGGLGGVYGEDRRQHWEQQDSGGTIAKEAKSDHEYAPDTRRHQPPPSEDKLEVRMSAGRDALGDEAVVHYQRPWLTLNWKGVTHDLIHLAVMLTRKQRGWISESKDLLKEHGPDRPLRMGPNDWSEASRQEEVIVDALEAAGIREGVLSENFWEKLAELAEAEDVPIPHVTHKMIADIMDNLEEIGSRNLDQESRTYPVH